ncbi:hypothetical protein JOC78_001593 [Bacillus ectoiniformans]|uniref:hypothetical protein n=1 Tax=Bacillus ectoiniformans TaxID=1494429 RepID=UPI001956BB5C|nr:hypothetical protein [Bacillus ectoiniformans]MBM7648647.1 hypothetical protein [Bacillus ectoiniformans]
MKKENTPTSELLTIIIDVIDSLGGTAHLKDIYEKIKTETFIDLNYYENPESRIRSIIYDHSSDCTRFKGKPGDESDLFYAVHKKGKGYWGLCSQKE